MIARMIRHWSVFGLIVATAIGLVAVLAPDPEPVGVAVRPTATPKPKPPADQRFRSRPALRPPALRVTGAADAAVFLSPKRGSGPGGPTILDAAGKLVWFHPMEKGKTADDFTVQRYRGRPVLTWWEGTFRKAGYGEGEWVIADRHYRTITRIRAGHGLEGDLHELQLTARGTALVSIYHRATADLTTFGSVNDADVMDSVIQEIDVASGRVLWEWHSLDHVGIGESYVNI